MFGPDPIINNSKWSRALAEIGYKSETYTDGICSSINTRLDYDRIIQDTFPWFSNLWARLFGFIEALFKYDYFVISFNGFFLGNTALWKLESFLLKMAKKRIIVFPFGLDAYIYHRIRSTSLMHGLMMSLPMFSKQQKKIAKRVDYWCTEADIVIPGLMGPDGIGRWDILSWNPIYLDLSKWRPQKIKNIADGINKTVVIAHAPNFRGFKGTEFIINSIDLLKREGLKIELILIEKKQNSEVYDILTQKADIHVEQIIATGHGLNAVEGMAAGLPVISNLEDETYTLPFRRWSFLNECPIVSASPETLTDVLRELVTNPKLREDLGKASRDYAVKYHGHDAAQYLFGKIVEKLEGGDVDLINLYNPLSSEFNRRLPKVKHPLKNNKIFTVK
ncbi:MAG: glycosyltransferase [Bacteroidetes bacterium]|nr:glycosyltransferase [Bacteroidota bacterium]MDA1119615.1 glycosyltransferase [Bacteroidota bacterium]